jgi:uncharacterized membrane protein
MCFGSGDGLKAVSDEGQNDCETFFGAAGATGQIDDQGFADQSSNAT